jgi:exosortase
VDPQPLADVVRAPGWRWTVGTLLVGVLFAFHQTLRDMAVTWATVADYSHGFLVAPFAAYLLWTRRHLLPPRVEWPDPVGLAAVAAGVGLAVAAGMLNFVKEFLQGVGLIVALAGVVMLAFGRRGLRWAWPGLLFLVFMAKLPDRVETQFLFKLRQVATQASNFALQTLGYPSYIAGPQGTVITVGDVRLGVEWACAGLSMVLTFVAVAAAVALLVERPPFDKAVILLSALPIAIVSNVIRITATSLVYVAGWQRLGDLIIHDLAGYLMMPLALAFVWLELRLIDWLAPPVVEPERDAVLKTVARTAAGGWVVREREASAADGSP